MTKAHWKKSVFRAAAFLTALTMLLSAVACSDQKDAAAVSASDKPAIMEMDIDEMPESLIDFLDRFTDLYYSDKGGHDFDCETNYTNLIHCMMLEFPCIDWYTYPVKPLEEKDVTRKKMDPKKWAKGFDNYTVCDEESVKWVVTNIFNVSEDKIPEMQEKYWNEKTLYLYKGKYYMPVGHLGTSYLRYELVSVKREGKRYYVDYNAYVNGYEMEMHESDGLLSGSFTAELELKNVDGKDYWSIYKAKQTKSSEDESSKKGE